MRRRVVGSRCPPGRPDASSSWARAGCATSSSPSSCCSWCTAAPTRSLRSPPRCPRWPRLAGGRLRGPGRRRQPGRRLPVPALASSTCSSCTSCAAPTPCPRTRPCCAGSAGHCGPRPSGRPQPRVARRRGPTRRPTSTAEWRQHAARGPAAAREAVLPAAARRGGPAADRGGPADAGRGPGPAGGARLRRSGRGAAAHRGADLRRVPPGGHPAHAAAGDARLVRRRGRARRRACSAFRQVSDAPRQLALVPAAAPGRHHGGPRGWPACWPSSRYATDLLLRAAGDGGHPGRRRPARARPAAALRAEAAASVGRHASRRPRWRRCGRCAAASCSARPPPDLLGLSAVEDTGEALTAVAGATVSAALQVAHQDGRGRAGPAARPGCASWRWAASAGTRPATAATPT